MPGTTSHWLRKTKGQLRRNPHVYSRIAQSEAKVSKYAGNFGRVLAFRRQRRLFALEGDEAQHLKKLRRDGFTLLPNYFDTDVIDTIRDQADRLLRDAQIDLSPEMSYSVVAKRLTSLEGFTYRELQKFEHHIGVRDPLLNIPEIVPSILTDSLLRITTHYLGYAPIRADLQVKRGFPLPNVESSLFHKDTHEGQLIKFFVLLSDVDEDHGPLLFVPGTHHHSVTAWKPQTGRDGRYSDEEIERFFPKETWVRFLGRRGSVLIADTNGIHKGPWWTDPENPRGRHRDLLQFRQSSLLGPAGPQKMKIRRDTAKRMTPIQRVVLRNQLTRVST